MERRHSKRISASLSAELAPGGENPAGFLDKDAGGGIKWYKFSGIIQNFSKDGIYLQVEPSVNPIDHSSGSVHKIQFQLLTKDTLNLLCKVVWSEKILLHRFGSKKDIDPPAEYTAIGMKILDPSKDYKRFVKARLKQHHIVHTAHKM
jgi:hypothetical protein